MRSWRSTDQMFHFESDPVEIFDPLLGGTLVKQALATLSRLEESAIHENVSEKPLLS